MILVATQLNTAETTLFVAPANRRTTIAGGVLCNTSAAAVTCSLSVCPGGVNAGTANRVIYNYSLAAGDSLALADYLSDYVLTGGDFISASASASGAVDLVLSGESSSRHRG